MKLDKVQQAMCIIAQREALALMQEYGLIKEGWTFRVKRRKMYEELGQCNYLIREISISAAHIIHDGMEAVLNSVKHEIAHALTPDACHGPAWRTQMLKMGLESNRCCETSKVPTPEKRYNYYAPCKCDPENIVHVRQRKIKRRYCCALCGYSLKWIKMNQKMLKHQVAALMKG